MKMARKRAGRLNGFFASGDRLVALGLGRPGEVKSARFYWLVGLVAQIFTQPARPGWSPRFAIGNRATKATQMF